MDYGLSMTGKKLIAIIFIFVMTTIAWMILGASNSSRTNKSFYKLKEEVASLYGNRLVMKAPQCYTKQLLTSTETVDNRVVEKEYYEYIHYEITKSDISIDVQLDQRKKGNLWFPTFKAVFSGVYEFAIDDYDAGKEYFLYSTLDSSDSIYNDISLRINDKTIDDVIPLIRKQEIRIVPNAQNQVRLEISYAVTGMEQLLYFITETEGEIAQINDFTLRMRTDFDKYDFPSDMMSPTTKEESGDGHLLIWTLNKSVTGKDIGLIIPNKLNPGEIVTRVSFFAPVSLLFFFVVIMMLSVIMKIKMHPMHYFFLAATFFSFHLMFSYFSDQMNIYLSFAISSCVSLALTMTYLRLIANSKMSYIYAPLTQLIYLVVFSFSFFFDGMTGIIVTICSVITLFILMQITGHIDWDEVFHKSRAEP